MEEIVQKLIADLPALLFWIIASLTAVCALAVVVTQNIVRSATWLLFTLCGVSALFFLLGADFVAATQLLVYVGGTLVLVIFGVMLTAQGPFVTMKTSAAEWGISAIAGLLLLAVLVISIFAIGHTSGEGTAAKYGPKNLMLAEVSDPKKAGDDGARKSPYADVIGMSFIGVGLGPAHTAADPNSPGSSRVIRMNYLLPFEIVSVHLLVVLIGAAYLARAKRRRAEA